MCAPMGDSSILTISIASRNDTVSLVRQLTTAVATPLRVNGESAGEFSSHTLRFFVSYLGRSLKGREDALGRVGKKYEVLILF